MTTATPFRLSEGQAEEAVRRHVRACSSRFAWVTGGARPIGSP